MKNFLFALLVIFIAYGCNQIITESKNLDATPIEIQSEQFDAPYCIYQLGNFDTLTIDKIQRIVSQLLPNYELVDSLSVEKGKNEYIINYFSDPKSEYPAPDIDYLQYSGHGLTLQEKNLLQSPYSAVLLVFSGVSKNVLNDHINLNHIISSLLQDTESIVMDYTTYELFNYKSWKEDRVSNFSETNKDITSQFTIHVYREHDFCRAVTLGLGKFCLPDISVQNISCLSQSSFGNLFNLISQTWIENPVIRTDSTMLVDITRLSNDSIKAKLSNSLETGATKKGIINLSFVEPQEGDAFNAQFELIFDDSNYNSTQAEQDALISQIFGATDSIEYITHDDKILKASQRAKDKLPELKKMFSKGLEPGYSILLKAPFDTDSGGREWMWVEVTRWIDTSIKGILQNEPFEISALSAGDIVRINQKDIFDYILYFPDGSTEGNETGRIISGEK